MSTVLLRLVSATDLPAADVGNTSDPYVKVLLAGKVVGKTKVKPKTLNPRWDEVVKVSLPKGTLLANTYLEFEIFDHDHLSKDDYLASAICSLAGTKRGEPVELWLPLEPRHRAPGDIPLGAELRVTLECDDMAMSGGVQPPELLSSRKNHFLAWMVSSVADRDLFLTTALKPNVRPTITSRKGPASFTGESVLQVCYNELQKWPATAPWKPNMASAKRLVELCISLMLIMPTEVTDSTAVSATNLPPFDPQTHYHFVNERVFLVNSLKAGTQKKTIGAARAATAAKPKYPILIVPGLASSALDVLRSESKPEWQGERCWIAIEKIGAPAALRKTKRLFHRRKDVSSSSTNPMARDDSDSDSESETVGQRVGEVVAEGLDEGVELAHGAMGVATAAGEKTLQAGKFLASRPNQLFRPGSAAHADHVEEEEPERHIDQIERVWLQHLAIEPDGVSDPPGIKLRPVDGLAGVTYLAASGPAKRSTYVFGKVVKNLIEVGYEPRNLMAAPYDWRLPPGPMNARDGYFFKVRMQIELLYQINDNTPVVVMCHSMGNRTAQYFWAWTLGEFPDGQAWIDKHVHMMVALGAPWLGASKTFRGLVTGDPLGLDFFLSQQEAREFGRSVSSLPFLFPERRNEYPDHVSRLKTKNNSDYNPVDPAEILATYAPGSNTWYRKYFLLDPYALSVEGADVATGLALDLPKLIADVSHQAATGVISAKERDQKIQALKRQVPALLQRPPVRITAIFGINTPTECAVYYVHGSDGSVSLDPNADKLSERVSAQNPLGLRIKKGIAYETANTPQRAFGDTLASGDGTVPYCSLAQTLKWEEQYRQYGGLPVENVVIEDTDHRAMLADEVVIDAILQIVCDIKTATSSLDQRAEFLRHAEQGSLPSLPVVGGGSAILRKTPAKSGKGSFIKDK